MRRLAAIPAAFLLATSISGGIALADPVQSPQALHLVGACDDGSGVDQWVTVGAGHAVLAVGTTEVRITLYLEVYSAEGEFLGSFASPSASHAPAAKTTWCSGTVQEDGSTFMEYDLLSH